MSDHEPESNRVKFKAANSVLIVRDVPASIAFYRDVLGFAVSFTYGEPVAFYAGVQRGAATLHLHAADHATRQPGHGSVYVFVDDADAYFEQITSRGVTVEGPPMNRPYGLRDFACSDPDGNRLSVASPSSYERPAGATDALPPHISVDVGLPEVATYVSLFRSVQWKPDEPSMRVALSNTLAGVIAIDTRDGQTVGMARTTGDGRYYMLWDVIVRPSHQGQKIGAAMVTKLIDELRSRGAPPGSFVGLFTAKPGFYGQLGFNNDFGMHRPL